MSPRHNPEQFFAPYVRDDDGTAYVDPSLLADEFDRNDESDAFACGVGADE